MKKIALVVLHFIGEDLTSGCLSSVEKLNRQDLKLDVFVINNNPKENLKALKKKFNHFIFLDTGKNLGFAQGNNFGIKQALKRGADFVFLVNNDTVLDENILTQLIKVMGSDKTVGIIGSKIYFAPGYEYHQERYKPSERGKVFWHAGGKIDWKNVFASHRGVDEVDKGQYDNQMAVDFVSGCAMFIRRELLEKIGLLDEKYFLYLEDADFCQRAKRAGFKVIYAPQAILWHFNARSSSVGGPLHDYFLTRNRMLFGLSYAPGRAKFALIRESFKIFLFGRPWQKLAVKDYCLRKFGKGSWRN